MRSIYTVSDLTQAIKDALEGEFAVRMGWRGAAASIFAVIELHNYVVRRLPLSAQELIANMLGVRREGVTGGARKLQKAGLIRYARGRITALDRSGLEGRSCECYSVVKEEYDRLLPEILAH